MKRRLIRCHCLAHGRRQFSDIEEVFPAECQVVIDVLTQVFDHDEEARDQQMSPQARLAYHQAYSGPLMDGLKRWLDQQVDDRLVEPNSSLGKAIAYMQGHWETLTRFLVVPGAPLDNNLVERALKLFIRQRKNSLFLRHRAQCLHRQRAHQPDCHLSPCGCQCPGVPGGVAGASRRGLCRRRRRGCPGPITRVWPRLRRRVANRAPSGRARDRHSTAE